MCVVVYERPARTSYVIIPEELVKLAPRLLPRLDDSYSYVRQSAVEAFGKLPAEELVELGPHLLPKLEDNESNVRQSAVEVFGKLPAEELVKLVPHLLPRLEDSY